MSGKILDDRRAALEEAFFAQKDAELVRRLHELKRARLAKEELSAASGITEDAVLDKIIALNIDASTVAALSLVPLVEVAWADGGIHDEERKTAFSRAAAMGFGERDVSRQIMEKWLTERPPRALLAAWKDYVKALSAALGKDAQRALRQEVMSHARAVAEAAGGFLGVAGKVSAAEERVLGELERAFFD